MGPTRIAEELVKRLEDAWNAADGTAYGAPFAPDADFVAIRGDHHSGQEIGTGHQRILDTIYAGSTITYTVVRARELDDRVILAHVRATLNAPAAHSPARATRSRPSSSYGPRTSTRSRLSTTRSSPPAASSSVREFEDGRSTEVGCPPASFP